LHLIQTRTRIFDFTGGNIKTGSMQRANNSSARKNASVQRGACVRALAAHSVQETAMSHNQNLVFGTRYFDGFRFTFFEI
jgi:hypothetical protein